MNVQNIAYDYTNRFTVEGYMQLMNAKPIALVVTDELHMPFKVGTVNENLQFERVFSFSKRDAAVAQFAALCAAWAAKTD